MYGTPIVRHVCGSTMLICLTCKKFFCVKCDIGVNIAMAACCHVAISSYTDHQHIKTVSSADLKRVSKVKLTEYGDGENLNE